MSTESKITTQQKADLSRYDNSWYKVGASKLKQLLWYITNALFFINPLNPSTGLKIFLLRLFGAKIGKGVIIKPAVNIKYPWKLTIGDHSWIGERVWIDNLAETVVGANCCISQGAMLLTGNHNYKKPTFDLITRGITIEDGAWIGAFSIVCPGTVIKSHAVLAVNAVASETLEPYWVYKGNPAVKFRERIIQN